MKSLLSAISYCHERNIIHRDLKPENILFDNISGKDRNFEIKVIDFGAAVFLDPGQLYNDRFGTVYYVAPEIVKGKGYNNKCDIWSMGVILFALLCGEVPFFA
jgi:calcium-dependent protein kinase